MKALLFDLDWTLVDIQGYTDYGTALEDVRELVGEWADVGVPDTSWDAPARICMEALVALAGDSRWQALSDAIERHELAAVPQSTPMTGLERLIDTVSDTPVAVVTLMGPEAARLALATHEVPFTTVVGRHHDLRPKPAPDQIIEACRLLGVPPSDTTMIGDSTWDMEAAYAARAGFIGITNHRPSEFAPGTVTVADLTELSHHLASSESRHH
ncbi:MAG: HAD-IA family hydrolase [Acidimicrobiia bacterium]|nr:HAD-IA family hydrolase [Acidimicrobiia bacterium]